MKRALVTMVKVGVIPGAVVTYITVSGLTGFCPTCTAIVNQVRGIGDGGDTATVAAAPSAGRIAEVSALTLQGEPVPLSTHRIEGRPMIVEVWSVTCVPCREQRDVLRTMVNSGRLDATVVAISADGDAARVREFLGDDDGPFVELLATPETLRALGGVRAVPALFFVDGQGAIRHAVTGLTPADRIEEAIRSIRG